MKHLLIEILLAILLIFLRHIAFGQGYEIVVDYNHTAAVVENGVVQSAADVLHSNYLGKIKENIETINQNTASVVLAQSMIYSALSNVNSALKDGLMVKDLRLIVADILRNTNSAVTLARAEPWLLLFAQQYAGQIKGRAVKLVADVSQFVLKEGKNVLMDYNARDELLKRVRQELQIIDGMAYGAWKAMFWAKERGIIASLNPYAGFINTDRAMIADILRNAKYLNN